MPGLDGPVDHHDVVIKNAGLRHGMPAGPQEIGRLGMGHQHLGQVNPLGAQVFGWRGKASAHAVSQQGAEQVPSRNESFPWSMALVERFADRWEWGDPGLCSNPGLTLPKLNRHQVANVMRACKQQAESMDSEVAGLVRSSNGTGTS